ncbi:MAG: AmmeMemoRadiSam system protein B [Euryarchaeota archaeon]|nr:AmmeMemoRadiSam system protein B [Euryarchaeota archaeon]
MIRKPAVSGLFYEGDATSLKRRIKWCFEHELGPGKLPEKMGHERNIKGVLNPHAGYVYSGPIAAHSVYKIVDDGFPEAFIILCPNHTGLGSGVSTMLEGEWETPLGNVQIDDEFAEKLIETTDIVDPHPAAHIQEHSCEVQIPLLQYFSNDFKIVPICMWMQDLETSFEIGISIKKAAEEIGRDIVLIASSDFTHYQPQDVAYEKDMQVLDAIKSFDERLMIRRVSELNVTMCGYGPVASTIVASKGLGAHKGEIIKYATSGDITGDYSSVVGYASAVFW